MVPTEVRVLLYILCRNISSQIISTLFQVHIIGTSTCAMCVILEVDIMFIPFTFDRGVAKFIQVHMFVKVQCSACLVKKKGKWSMAVWRNAAAEATGACRRRHCDKRQIYEAPAHNYCTLALRRRCSVIVHSMYDLYGKISQ